MGHSAKGIGQRGMAHRAEGMEQVAWGKEHSAWGIGHGAWRKEHKMAKFRFQDLEIWKEAIEIGDALFDIADKLEEKKLFRFAEQLRGAGMSMSNNIAEGAGSNSKAEFRNFLNMARRSTFENANILILLNKRGLIDTSTIEFMLERLEMLCRKITNFQRSLDSVKRHAPCPMPHALITNEKGTILVTMLLLMIIVTLVGVIAINTATVDIQITGNTKRESIAMGAAEAGVDLSIPIIELTLAAGQLTTSSSAVVYTIGSLANLDDGGTYDKDTTTIETEIFDDQLASVLVGFDIDVSISSFGSDAAGINLDIDRMYSYAIEGSSIEFAAGYEGIGAGAGGGGIGILYKINSQGTK